MLSRWLQNPAKDAAKIHAAIDYRVLRAAWDGYVRIKRTGFQHSYRIATPAWFALFAVRNHKGKFSQFDIDELHLLKAFTAVHYAYDEIVQSLADNADNEKLTSYILSNHPDLHDSIPLEYFENNQVNEYMIGVIRTYQGLLKEFYGKYHDDIENTILRLENSDAARMHSDTDDESAGHA